MGSNHIVYIAIIFYFLLSKYNLVKIHFKKYNIDKASFILPNFVI